MRDNFGMAEKRRSTWKKGESEALFKMCKEGKTLKEIHKEFPNKPESSIRTKIYSMGFSVKGMNKKSS